MIFSAVLQVWKELYPSRNLSCCFFGELYQKKSAMNVPEWKFQFAFFNRAVARLHSWQAFYAWCIIWKQSSTKKENSTQIGTNRDSVDWKQKEKYFSFHTHTHTPKGTIKECRANVFLFISQPCSSSIHTEECKGKGKKNSKWKLKTIFYSFRSFSVSSAFFLLCICCATLCVCVLFFAYLVAKSLCTKFICSKYFIPEAICVAMYIKQP